MDISHTCNIIILYIIYKIKLTKKTFQFGRFGKFKMTQQPKDKKKNPTKNK